MLKMLYTEPVFEKALYFFIIRRWHTVDPIATYILELYSSCIYESQGCMHYKKYRLMSSSDLNVWLVRLYL
jgi:hypothetical protein